MSTAVVCLGNELVGDDGVGIRVGRVLRGLELPSGVTVIVRANVGLELIELMAEHERVVIVDAMTGVGEPGTCAWMDLESAWRMASCPSCLHSLGIPELAALARAMYPDRPLSSLGIVGIEGAVLDTFGVGLSQSVAAAMPRAVELVLRAVGASEALRDAARAEAEREASALRGLAQVLDEAGPEPGTGR